MIQKVIKNCPICKKKMPIILKLGKHPLCDDLIKIGSKRKNNLYNINLLLCKKCIIICNQVQIKEKILFPSTYHYRGKLTNDVLLGQINLVKNIELKYGNLKNKLFVDIGCNDGALLDILAKKKAKTLGVEPTSAANDCKSTHHIYKNFFNIKTAKKIKKKYPKVDFITFTNVFAHINKLGELIKALQILINDKTVIVIENHYIGSILKTKQFDTFYHEHPRTYSLTSLKNIAKKIGMNISYAQFPKRYGGNIRVFFSKRDNISKYKNIIKKEKKYLREITKLKNFVNLWISYKKKQILSLNKKYGALSAKAFPGRAAILINLLKLNNKNISRIYEKKNSKKIGYFAPNTNIPIVSDNSLNKIKYNEPILNLAWHINDEIKSYLKLINIKNKVIPILDAKEIKKTNYK